MSFNMLPTEIVRLVLGHMLVSDVPVDLEEFWRRGRSLKRWESTTPLARRLDSTQEEHQLDWVAVNSTCHQFQAIGRELFWSSKTFVLRPRYLDSWILGPGPVMHDAVQHIRSVIAPVPMAEDNTEINCIPSFSMLPVLRDLVILYGYDGWSRRTHREPIVKAMDEMRLLESPPKSDLQTLDLNQANLTVQLACTVHEDPKQSFSRDFERPWASLVKTFETVEDEEVETGESQMGK